eukprot:9090245-Lingulodinium_polyedra.AAC.2
MTTWLSHVLAGGLTRGQYMVGAWFLLVDKHFSPVGPPRSGPSGWVHSWSPWGAPAPPGPPGWLTSHPAAPPPRTDGVRRARGRRWGCTNRWPQSPRNHASTIFWHSHGARV